MVSERDGNAIVVDGLFVDADLQVGEGENIGTMGGFLGFRTRQRNQHGF
ncbi:hypothetical protein ACTNES_13370 [Blautia sp. HCP3S3_D9]